MKIIITESQYRLLIEQEEYTEQLISLINSNDKTNLEMVKEMLPGLGIDLIEFLSDNIDQIEPPYFNKLELLGIDNEIDLKRIIDELNPRNRINFDNGTLRFLNWQAKTIYSEDIFFGFWEKWEYSPDNKFVYHETSEGRWNESEYNEIGKRISYKDSEGFWDKAEYDSNGNLLYYENSEGLITDRKKK